jgi:hypothetical protein
MSSLEQNLETLRAAGWQLVAQRPGSLEPIPGYPDVFRRTPGNFVIERRWRGTALREVDDESLEKCVERALWQQRRIESLEDEPVRVSEGAEFSDPSTQITY